MMDPSSDRMTAFTPLSDPRKTAQIAQDHRSQGIDAVQINDAAAARTILRSKCVRQAGFGAETIFRGRGFGKPPVIMLDGEAHRRQRMATAPFFSPAVVSSRYSELMEVTAQELVNRLRKQGKANLEELSMELAVTVAAEIVGMTNSDRKGMSARMTAFFRDGGKPGQGRLSRAVWFVISAFNRVNFMIRDVLPAIRSRRRKRRMDVISHLIDEGYRNQDILVECITYGLAGMVTTREFILMAFWQLMENPSLRDRFLDSDRQRQIYILEEILRTEPIIAMLSRRSDEEVKLPTEPPMTFPAGTLFEIDIRHVNSDENAVGNCPFMIDADRSVAQKTGGSMFAFGDGAHRCPGAQVAMHESAIFLDLLLRVPGLEIASFPTITWKPMFEGYEISNFTVRCK